MQYLDPATNKWVFYKNKEALVTGEKYDTPAEEITQINLEPFKAKSAAIWLINEGDNDAPCARVDFVISPDGKHDEAPEPPATAVKAMMDLGYPYKLKSQHSKAWANPRLDSPSGAHIQSEQGMKREDYWIETDFDKPLDVYAVILKRRADSTPTNSVGKELNSHIYVQYKDPSSGQWVWYQGKKENYLPTGAQVSDEAEKELKINLEPFKATAVAVWFRSQNYIMIAARMDVLVEPPAKAPEPPAEAKKAILDMGATF